MEGADLDTDAPSENNTENKAEKAEDSPDKVVVPPEGNESAVAGVGDVTESVDFKVVYNKQKYDVSFPLDTTVEKLKIHMQSLINIPPAMQKVMFKGLAKDERTLRDLGVTKAAKVMVVGSKLNDVLAVTTPAQKESHEEKGATSKEPLSKQKQHLKIIEKGIPEDAMPGIKNTKESLPQVPLSGMVNKSGGKVRLTFKLEQDQLWLGTKERTDKIPMNTIKNISSEPIEGHEEYHMMAIQLGPTDASKYWIYWVPAQFVDAIKDAVLGEVAILLTQMYIPHKTFIGDGHCMYVFCGGDASRRGRSSFGKSEVNVDLSDWT